MQIDQHVDGIDVSCVPHKHSFDPCFLHCYRIEIVGVYVPTRHEFAHPVRQPDEYLQSKLRLVRKDTALEPAEIWGVRE